MKYTLSIITLLCFSLTAHADSIVNARVGITPIGDPLGFPFGRVGASYVLDGVSNGFVFWTHADPFSMSGDTLTFIPGEYENVAGEHLFETLTITRTRHKMLNFFFELFPEPPLPGETSFIETLDFLLPRTITPELNDGTGTEGDRFYVPDVAMRIGSLPFTTDPPQRLNAAAVSEVPENDSATFLAAGMFFMLGAGFIVVRLFQRRRNY